MSEFTTYSQTALNNNLLDLLTDNTDFTPLSTGTEGKVVTPFGTNEQGEQLYLNNYTGGVDIMSNMVNDMVSSSASNVFHFAADRWLPTDYLPGTASLGKIGREGFALGGSMYDNMLNNQNMYTKTLGSLFPSSPFGGTLPMLDVLKSGVQTAFGEDAWGPNAVSNVAREFFPFTEQGKTSFLDMLPFAGPAAKVGVNTVKGATMLSQRYSPYMNKLLSKSVPGQFSDAVSDMAHMYPDVPHFQGHGKLNQPNFRFGGTTSYVGSKEGIRNNPAQSTIGVGFLPEGTNYGGVYRPSQINIGIGRNPFYGRSVAQHELLHYGEDMVNRLSNPSLYPTTLKKSRENPSFIGKYFELSEDILGTNKIYGTGQLKFGDDVILYGNKKYPTVRDAGIDNFTPIQDKIKSFGATNRPGGEVGFTTDEGLEIWKYLSDDMKSYIREYEKNAYNKIDDIVGNTNDIDKRMELIEDLFHQELTDFNKFTLSDNTMPWKNIKSNKAPKNFKDNPLATEYWTNPYEITARLAQVRLKSSGWEGAYGDLKAIFGDNLDMVIKGVDDAGNKINIGGPAWGGSKSSIGLKDNLLSQYLMGGHGIQSPGSYNPFNTRFGMNQYENPFYGTLAANQLLSRTVLPEEELNVQP